jgi:hypothetical protein
MFMGAGRGKNRRARFANARTLQTVSDHAFTEITAAVVNSEPLYDTQYAQATEEYRAFQRDHGTSFFLADRMCNTPATRTIWEKFGREVKPGEQPIDRILDRQLTATTNVFDISQTRSVREPVSTVEWEAREVNAQRCNDFLEEELRGVNLILVSIPSAEKIPLTSEDTRHGKDLQRFARAVHTTFDEINELNFDFALGGVGSSANSIVAINSDRVELKYPDATPGEARARIIAHELAHALMSHQQEFLKTYDRADARAGWPGDERDHISRIHETEAEFFAQHIMKEFGISATEKYSREHLRRYGLFNQEDLQETRQCYERSIRTAQDLLDSRH